MTKLKPCPFCGGEASLSASSSGVVIWCNDSDHNPECTARVVEHTEEEAIKAWNRRRK